MERYKALVEQFDLEGSIVNIREFGSGHINTTFLVEMEQGGVTEPYILQLINTDIFKNPDELMENIIRVTSYLREKIGEQGGDTKRGTLHVILTKDGKGYCKDTDGKCYRMYDFIKGRHEKLKSHKNNHNCNQ